MKLNRLRLLATALPLSLLASCGVAHVQSGKAIYCPNVQLQKLSPELMVDDKNWEIPAEEEGYADVTNLLNGKKTRTHILMRKTTNTGTVIISINKKTAEALGMVYTGLAPVEIKYKRTL
jgi:hypothetical protein